MYRGAEFQVMAYTPVPLLLKVACMHKSAPVMATPWLQLHVLSMQSVPSKW